MVLIGSPMYVDMEQRVMQWLTFGCHQFGARVAGKVQLHTELKQLEQIQEDKDKMIELLQKARANWDLNSSVSLYVHNYICHVFYVFSVLLNFSLTIMIPQFCYEYTMPFLDFFVYYCCVLGKKLSPHHMHE